MEKLFCIKFVKVCNPCKYPVLKKYGVTKSPDQIFKLTKSKQEMLNVVQKAKFKMQFIANCVINIIGKNIFEEKIYHSYKSNNFFIELDLRYERWVGAKIWKLERTSKQGSVHRSWQFGSGEQAEGRASVGGQVANGVHQLRGEHNAGQSSRIGWRGGGKTHFQNRHQPVYFSSSKYLFSKFR